MGRGWRFAVLVAVGLTATFSLSACHSPAQADHTTVSEILTNPGTFDGKRVSVEGRVDAPKFKSSKRGKPYTTFSLVDQNKTLSVFSFGTLPLRQGEVVRVIGRFAKVKRMGKYVFYDEIDASKGSVETLR
jgi:cytochrome c-type biogenesis protein CcmE